LSRAAAASLSARRSADTNTSVSARYNICQLTGSYIKDKLSKKTFLAPYLETPKDIGTKL